MIDLRGVFSRFEGEWQCSVGAKHFGDMLIKLTKKRVLSPSVRSLFSRVYSQRAGRKSPRRFVAPDVDPSDDLMRFSRL